MADKPPNVRVLRPDDDFEKNLNDAVRSPEWQGLSEQQRMQVVDAARRGVNLPLSELKQTEPGLWDRFVKAQSNWARGNQEKLEESLFFLEEGARQQLSKTKKRVKDMGATDIMQMLSPTGAAQKVMEVASEGVPEALAGATRAALPQGESADVMSGAPDQPPGPPPPDPTEGAAGMARQMHEMERATMSINAPQVHAQTGKMQAIAQEIAALRQTGANPERLAAMEKAYDAENAALLRGQETARERQDQEVAKQLVEQKHMQRINESQSALKSQFEARMAAKQSEIEDWKDKHGALDMNDAIMQKSPLGIISAVLTGIGTSMGAFAATMMGTENFAARLAEQGLNARLQAKKSEIAQSAAMGRELKNEYYELREIMGDELAADMAFKLRDMDAVLKGMDAEIAKMQGEEQLANADANRQALMAKREQMAMDLETRMQAQSIQGLQAEGNLQNQIMTAKMREDQVNATLAMQARKLARSGQSKGKQISASTVLGLSQREQGVNKIKALRKDFEKLGPESVISRFFPGTDASNYDERRKPIAMQLARAMFGGSQQAVAEAKRLEDALPKSWNWSSTARAQFQGWIDSAIDAYNTDVSALARAGYDVSGFSQMPESGEADPLAGIPSREAF